MSLNGDLRQRRVVRWLGLDALAPTLRPLVGGGFASAVGSGLWFTIWALYLTRRLGFSDGQAGLALTVAGAVGFLGPAPVGRLADRLGPREIYGGLLAIEGVSTAGLLACHGFMAVTAVASVTAFASQSATGVRAALVAQLAGAEQRITAMACLRSCAHAGDALGAGLGAVVIAVGSGPAYAAAIALDAASYLVYAAAVARVPHVPPCARPRRETGAGAARDLPFLGLAAICGFLTLCWGLMSAGLPLWIAQRTAAPHALAGVIVLLSSIAIAALQVPVSRGVRTPRAAARIAGRSGLSLALCCALVAAAAGPGIAPACALLLAAAGAHIAGELWFVAASWGLSVPLMPPDRPAEYQGVFATGEALAIMLAPALMSAVIVPGGVGAWLILGGAFAAVGAAARPLTAWALRTRAPGASASVAEGSSAS